MKTVTKIILATAAIASSTTGMAQSFGLPVAKADIDALVRVQPIGGQFNRFWQEYKTDISEAQYEYGKDIARATDLEDRQDALLEYRSEVLDAEKDYAKEMRERGFSVPSVTLLFND